MTTGIAFLLQTISLGRRGPNASNVDQSTTQGAKGLKGNRKAHHAEHPSQKVGSSVTSSSSADAATPEEGPGSTTSTVETSAPAGGSEGGARHVPGNGGGNERSRGNYWRGQDNVGGFGGPRQRNGRDQVRSNNHQWNNQRGFRMNNGPAVALRTGSNRNYNNRNMFNNNMSEFGNPAGVIHVLVRFFVFYTIPVTALSEVCYVKFFLVTKAGRLGQVH